MRLKKLNIIGIAFGVIILLIDVVFFFNMEDKNLFLFVLGISIGVITVPFVIQTAFENRKEEEIGEMFLEFSRNLAESVTTGTPISKSIVNMKKKNYGLLSPYIEKLANQIELGISVDRALHNFARDVDNTVISRAVALITEAERAGGEIDYILESVAKSISEVEKLKKERKAAIYSLVVQGYIIFFIFIGIMLVMQFKILPLASGASNLAIAGGTGLNPLSGSVGKTGGAGLTSEDLARQFLYLLLAQGLFAGLTIGKVAEGSLKAGIKHSFILTITAFLISTGANYFLSAKVA